MKNGYGSWVKKENIRSWCKGESMILILYVDSSVVQINLYFSSAVGVCAEKGGAEGMTSKPM